MKQAKSYWEFKTEDGKLFYRFGYYLINEQKFTPSCKVWFSYD